MATINLGRVGYVHKGAYAAATTYQKYDVVLYNHGSYLYIGESASQGHAPTDTAYWQAMLDPTQMNAATEAAVNAAEAAHASALELAGQVDRLTTPFSITGDTVTCYPVSDYPLGVISYIEPVQAGSGDPSPSNVRPITGWTGAKAKRVGKNLLPIEPQAEVLRTKAIDFSEKPLQPGEYVLSGRLSSTGTDYNYCTVIFYGAKEGGGDIYVNCERDVQLAEVITFVNPCTMVYFCAERDYASSANDTLTLTHVQLEHGSAATAYEPYQGNQYTADFGQTVYGGELDWKTGVLKITGVLLAFDGTETWYSSVSGSVYYIPRTSIGSEMQPMPNSNGQKLSSHYTTDRMSGADYLYFYDTVNGADLDTWKAYLKAQYAAGTPVQIFYKLAVPKEIQLTPQQILSLAGENNLWSDCGQTTVNGPNSPRALENRIAALEAAIANMA